MTRNFDAVDCAAHGGAQKEIWVVCTHTDAITTARFVEDNVVRGDALCPECRRLVDARQPGLANLAIACGGCVLARWPLEPSCDRPPAGWRCTRRPGHEGPCAAVPIEKAS